MHDGVRVQLELCALGAELQRQPQAIGNTGRLQAATHNEAHGGPGAIVHQRGRSRFSVEGQRNAASCGPLQHDWPTRLRSRRQCDWRAAIHAQRCAGAADRDEFKPQCAARGGARLGHREERIADRGRTLKLRDVRCRHRRRRTANRDGPPDALAGVHQVTQVLIEELVHGAVRAEQSPEVTDGHVRRHGGPVEGEPGLQVLAEGLELLARRGGKRTDSATQADGGGRLVQRLQPARQRLRCPLRFSCQPLPGIQSGGGSRRGTARCRGSHARDLHIQLVQRRNDRIQRRARGLSQAAETGVDHLCNQGGGVRCGPQSDHVGHPAARCGSEGGWPCGGCHRRSRRSCSTGRNSGCRRRAGCQLPCNLAQQIAQWGVRSAEQVQRIGRLHGRGQRCQGQTVQQFLPFDNVVLRVSTHHRRFELHGIGHQRGSFRAQHPAFGCRFLDGPWQLRQEAAVQPCHGEEPRHLGLGQRAAVLQGEESLPRRAQCVNRLPGGRVRGGRAQPRIDALIHR